MCLQLRLLSFQFHNLEEMKPFQAAFTQLYKLDHYLDKLVHQLAAPNEYQTEQTLGFKILFRVWVLRMFSNFTTTN
jgi:hypothetical protein